MRGAGLKLEVRGCGSPVEVAGETMVVGCWLFGGERVEVTSDGEEPGVGIEQEVRRRWGGGEMQLISGLG